MSDWTELVVHKYGGTSLTSTQHVQRAAAQLDRAQRGGRPVVAVVSARGKTTDELLAEAAAIGTRPSDAGPGWDREIDQLLACGENSSAALLALALRSRGVPTVSLSGPQAGITTSGRHGAGTINAIDPSRIGGLLRDGNVAVVSGFQAANRAGDVVTLGRGGSDTTAVAIAAEFGGQCDIFTDVDGVHTADPRHIPDAGILAAVDSRVMAEMAFAGARVLHSRAAALAAAKKLRLRIRNSGTDAIGTTIVERSDHMPENASFVTAVVHDLDTAAMTIRCPASNDSLTTDVFAVLARENISTDLVHVADSDPGDVVMRFSLKRSELPIARAALQELFYGKDSIVHVVDRVAKVSLVGAGLLNRPDSTALMLTTLSANAIRSSWVYTGQTRTSVLVPEDRALDAVALLHSAFELGRPEPELVVPV
ncbi:aspartate kinase [Saccharopolyspora taberi]|uniref:Aspartokinase n=1 Tax=Saccharopolyspora taberi TaxID=60895 RepID=A0ABN3V4Q2_9PSEU